MTRGWPEGVEPLDHTADAGLRIRAETLPLLLERAAAGMRTLVEGEEAGATTAPVAGRRVIELEALDAASLLAAWLRELLHLHQVERRAFAGASFLRLGETTLRAEVSLRASAEPVREIKGVTYHGLEVARDAKGWRARVIFDV